MSPSHAGSADLTGPEGTILLPQLSTIVGGVGSTASIGQLMMDPSFGSIIKSSNSMVTVCTQSWVFPSQSVYVQV